MRIKDDSYYTRPNIYFFLQGSKATYLLLNIDTLQVVTQLKYIAIRDARNDAPQIIIYHTVYHKERRTLMDAPLVI